MRGLFPALVAISILAACSNDMSVHVRGGDRPPNPEELVREDDAAGSGGLAVNGGVTVDSFQIVLRNMRLQEAPTDGGVAASESRGRWNNASTRHCRPLNRQRRYPSFGMASPSVCASLA